MRIPEMNLNSDADSAEFIIEAIKLLASIAKKKGIRISVTCDPDGTVLSDFGEYTYLDFPGVGESYEYRPKDKIREWKEVIPEQINFGGKTCSKDT